ncbi:MAG: LysE family transporter [Euryarchaeota archaeon]|nr:LysE family transporter [Euryarchaeota archaeon]
MIDLLAFGFVIGLTGAVVPGPMLFATIEASLRKGWIAGPEIVLGHAAIEIMICAVIFFGFSIANDMIFQTVSLVGGGALIAFGIATVNSSKNATFDMDKNITSNPVIAGALTSVSNPYFLIWWLTIGNTLVMDGLRISFVAAVLFVVGHWIADITWYAAISISSSKGRKVMSDRVYGRVLSACGLFLISFGLYYVVKIFV